MPQRDSCPKAVQYPLPSTTNPVRKEPQLAQPNYQYEKRQKELAKKKKKEEKLKRKQDKGDTQPAEGDATPPAGEEKSGA